MLYEKGIKTDKFGMHSTDKDYSLAVDGLYQGMYDSYIDVIGDNMGRDTSVVYLLTPLNLNIVLTSYIIPFRLQSSYLKFY